MLTTTRRLILAGAAIAAIACGGDSGTGPSAQVQGTYNLTSYNGQPLPFSFTESGSQGGTLTITYLAPFSITLNPDNTMRIISTTRFTFNGVSEQATDTLAGTWSLTGNTVAFKADGEDFSAAWNGSNQLMFSSPPDVLIFTK